MPRKFTDDKFHWKMPAGDYRLGQWVEIDLYGYKEVFTVVGIRQKELELKGDWSGGTSPEQVGWYPVEKCNLVMPNYGNEWITIKNGNDIQ